MNPLDERAPVVGYGTVRAKHQVDIIPQVSGQLVQVHRNLAPGKVIPKGELLFEIASDVYQARVRQAEAETRGLEASLARNDQEGMNLDERIKTLEQIVEIERRDYDSARDLFERDDVGTKRDVDMIYKAYLRQRDALVELRNRRDLMPHLRAETQAKLDAARAKLAQVKEDLENTQIRCPFKARVDLVSAHKSQVVTAFFMIARLTDMEAFEISVGIDPRELRWLDPSVRPAALRGDPSAEKRPVIVRWALHDQEFVWRGYVTRFERVDEVTRTARMVVEIRDVDMTATVESGAVETSPELAIGMYCKTELPALQIEDALLVPRHAIHDNRFVYVFEPDGEDGRIGRLARREVPTLRPIGENVLVDFAGRTSTEVCELRAGDQVVISPLDKPVDGMRIGLRDDVVAQFAPRERLRAWNRTVWRGLPARDSTGWKPVPHLVVLGALSSSVLTSTEPVSTPRVLLARWNAPRGDR